MRSSNQKREGLALFVILVCVFMLGVLLVMILQLAFRRHKEVQLQMNRAQASCLAESGLRLAAARLESDPNYAGETWKIPPESLGGAKGAAVTIEVKPTDDEKARLVKAIADYPSDSEKRARISKEMTIQWKQ
ncbi:MAG: hypothetical protein PVH19_09000 [Planctomycetia bacterium]|jgi:hypothetical protein